MRRYTLWAFLITLVGGSAMGGAGYMWYAGYNDLAQAQQRYARAQADKQVYTAVDDQLPDASQAALEGIIPRTLNASAIVANITSVAQEAGLSLVSFDISNDPVDTQARKRAYKPPVGVQVYQMSIVVSGGQTPSLYKFLSQLARRAPFIAVTGVNFTSAEGRYALAAETYILP